MGKSHRAAKVADRIKVVVASALESKVRDPRLGFVTITDVRVTGDLQQASIFYESAKGLLRTEVGRELGTRITPSLTFFADALGENAKNFEDLLDQVRKSDEEIANLRSSAEPISGDDPYRQSRPKDYLSGE